MKNKTLQHVVQAIESERKMWQIITAIVLLAGSVAFVVYKIVNDHNYKEKWKDYDDCGLS